MMLLSFSVFSQGPPPPPPPPGLPITGGLSYLLIVGVAYGVYAIRKRLKD
jgi:hypothetical protein